MLGFLIAALVALPCDAPVAKIEGPKSVKMGEVFHLDASGSVSDKPIKWKFNGKPTPFRVLDEGDRKGVVALGVGVLPGTVMRFTAMASGVPPGSTELEADVAVWDVVVDGDTPKPPTPPKPDPTPTPTPDPPAPTPGPVVTERVYMIYIADATAKVSEFAKQSALKASDPIRQAAKDHDAVFRWYRSDESEPEKLGWMAKVTAADGPGLPCVFFVTQSNREVSRLKAPSADAVVAELKRLRGVK